MSLAGNTQVIVRGATVQFATNFFDVNGVLVQPNSAAINIVPSLAPTAPILIQMTPPNGNQTRWTARLETRNIPAPQTIYWSIHTGGVLDVNPVTAEDGNFQLSANPANLPNF